MATASVAPAPAGTRRVPSRPPTMAPTAAAARRVGRAQGRGARAARSGLHLLPDALLFLPSVARLAGFLMDRDVRRLDPVGGLLHEEVEVVHDPVARLHVSARKVDAAPQARQAVLVHLV